MGVVVSYLAFGSKTGGSVANPYLGVEVGAHKRAKMPRLEAQGNTHFKVFTIPMLPFNSDLKFCDC